MQTAYIPNKDELQELIQQSVAKEIQEQLPEAIRKATRKKWLTTAEVMELLQISRRQAQFLRDSKRLPYRQNGRTIRYDIDEVEAYLNRGKVEAIDE